MCEMSISFICWQGSSPHLQGFSLMVGSGEGVGRFIHGGGNKQDKSRWKIFGKIENAGGITQGDNSAKHCFVLRQGRSHWGDQGAMTTPTSISEPKNVQQFQFQRSDILFFMGVQKL